MIKRGLITAEYQNHMGNDLDIVDAARVSFNKKSSFDEDGNLSERDKRLLRYLAKHNHWSPFTHGVVKFRYNVPIFVARQEFKHIVGMTRNEVSRRYVDDVPEFFLPDEWRAAPTDGAKQGSGTAIIKKIKLVDYMPPSYDDQEGLPTAHYYEEDIDQFVEAGFRDALYRYETLIANNVAPEQARMVLPQAMFTSYIVTGSLYAFANFVKLRTDPHAQKEIRDLALATAPQIEPLFPESWKVLMNV